MMKGSCFDNSDKRASPSLSLSSSDDSYMCCLSSPFSPISFGGDSDDQERRKAKDADMKNPDIDLAEEFNQLSIEERNQVYEDIHGSSKPIPETPELLRDSLSAMQVELDKKLQKLKVGNTNDKNRASAYEIALQKGKSHVEDPKLRLCFLRSERFDANLAADRFLNYFHAVKDIYGEQVLGRQIRMSDLGTKELAELKEGHVQFLSQRDSAGRAIQFLDPIPLMAMYAGDVESELVAIRSCFYMVMRTMLGSVETQRNGICTVFYGVDGKVKNQVRDFQFPRARFINTVGRCFTSVPMRVNSVHFVYNDSRLRPFMFLFQYALGRVIRARFQTHHGTPMECNWALASFGIPVSAFPVDDDCCITYTKHQKSLNRYRKRESGLHDNVEWDKAEILPKRNDVLLGRGVPYQSHSGNVALKDMIKRHWKEYDSAKGRGGKQAIAMRIVEEIQASGGRFLKLDDATEWWIPVSQQEAQLKVSQGFRKKREMDLATSRAKKDSNSGKRTKVHEAPEARELQKPATDTATDGVPMGSLASTPPTSVCDSDSSDSDTRKRATRHEKAVSDNHGKAVPASHDEIVGLFGGPTDTLTPDELEYLIESPPQPVDATQGEDPLSRLDDISACSDMGLADIDVSALADNMISHEKGVTTKDDPMLSFLKDRQDCFKCSPQETFDWLHSQDIMTLEDLHEACRDDEFVDLEFKVKGGLKGFKKHPFIKAILSAASSQ